MFTSVESSPYLRQPPSPILGAGKLSLSSDSNNPHPPNSTIVFNANPGRMIVRKVNTPRGRVGRPVRFQMTHEHLLQVTPLATLLGDLQLNLRHVLLQLAHADE
uniref:Uncharacterized protein n=1 Tax=Anopheles melas TaxID=34690 RepID=A0A182TDK9_9DIPT